MSPYGVSSTYALKECTRCGFWAMFYKRQLDQDDLHMH